MSGWNWKISEHVHRECLGRLLFRRDGRRTIVRCAKCGAEAEGEIEGMCCCGIEVKTFGKMFECIRNPDPTPGFPAEIVARERPRAPPIKPVAAPKPMPRRSWSVLDEAGL
jgi:hypothetical protein